MLERIPTSSETLRHICDCFGRKYVESKPAVYIHDVNAYMEFDGQQQSISFCPYCGIRVDNESRP